MRLYLDFETRSEVDLTKVGAWNYSKHPSTQIQCVSWAVEGGPIHCLSRDELDEDPVNELWQDIIDTPNLTVVAHNAFFEQCIWKNIMVPFYAMPEIPPNKWMCTMAKAAAANLPMKLEKLGPPLGLPVQKDMEGHRLMMRMSKPRRAKHSKWFESPQEIARLMEYNKTDIETERFVDMALPDLNTNEQRVWLLDQQINFRGVQIDRQAVENVLLLIEEHKTKLLEEFKQVTNRAVEKPTQRAKFLQWLQAEGLRVWDTQAETLAPYLDNPTTPKNVKRAIQILAQLGKSSTAKYPKMLQGIDSENRVRELLAYHTAGTGRWGGRGFQPQNLPIPTEDGLDSDTVVKMILCADYSWFAGCYEDFMGALSTAVRGMIWAKEGFVLIGGDYSQIECRVTAWLANEQELLSLFARKEDPYKWMAAKIFSKSISLVTKPERNKYGKSSVLGCGFQMGFRRFSEQYDVELDLAKKCVNTYRESFPNIKKMWNEMEAAAILAVESGYKIECGKVTFAIHGEFLYCKLPSGRCLSFHKPKLSMEETPWSTAEEPSYKKTLSYMGEDPNTHQYGRVWMYGGKFVENIVQAIARDIMAEAMLRVEEAGYPVILTIHDEIISEIPIGFGSIEEFEALMAIRPKWAQDLPIEVEGWKRRRYKK